MIDLTGWHRFNIDDVTADDPLAAPWYQREVGGLALPRDQKREIARSLRAVRNHERRLIRT